MPCEPTDSFLRRWDLAASSGRSGVNALLRCSAVPCVATRASAATSTRGCTGHAPITCSCSTADVIRSSASASARSTPRPTRCRRTTSASTAYVGAAQSTRTAAYERPGGHKTTLLRRQVPVLRRQVPRQQGRVAVRQPRHPQNARLRRQAADAQSPGLLRQGRAGWREGSTGEDGLDRVVHGEGARRVSGES